jgi:hypothetical protein
MNPSLFEAPFTVLSNHLDHTSICLILSKSFLRNLIIEQCHFFVIQMASTVLSLASTAPSASLSMQEIL